MLDRETFLSLFNLGEIIDSGGSRSRANAARLQILGVDDQFVRYRSLRSKSFNKFRFSYIDVVLTGFSRIDPESIRPSIQQVFFDAGLQKNYSTENYVYGFAKEIQRRQALRTPFLTMGERLDEDYLAASLVEGSPLRVIVDRQERNPEAVRQCKSLHGVICFACGFDFERFYGALGKGFIHAHHLKPMAASKKRRIVDPRTDLIPLCPNCHAMVHHGPTLLSANDLKTLIERAKRSSVAQ